jgi:N-acetylmuramoyl-L-alanine amidase
MGVLRTAAAAALAAWMSFAAAAAATPAATATATRLGGDNARTRLVIDIDRAVPIHAFTLAAPYRVVLDLDDTVFHAPPPEAGRGLVSAYRFGLIAPGRSRVVIDVKRPVTVERTFTVEAAEGEPAHVVVELAPTSRDRFQQALALQSPAVAEAPQRPSLHPSLRSADDSRPLIVLDPGHGGIDMGTHAPSGELEKDVVLQFALALRDKLQAGDHFRVVLTREDDSFVSLPGRVRVAREAGARLFVSIHADSLQDSQAVRGATVYTLSDTASDAEAARLAEAENRADIISGVDLTDEPDAVADILIDLARRETRTFSARFARTLAAALKDATPLNKNPMRSAGFRVLKAPDVPSVLLELGYMSSKQDLKLLTSAAWRDKTTDAVAASIGSFFGTRMTAATGTLN